MIFKFLKKSSFLLLCLLIFSVLSTFKSHAMSAEDNYSFDALIDSVYNNQGRVTTFEGLDITDKFIQETASFRDNHTQVKEWLTSNESYVHKIVYDSFTTLNSYSSNPTDKYRFYRDYFGFGLRGKGGYGYIEVTSELHCGAWVNIVNETITRIDTPVYIVTGIYTLDSADIIANNMQTGSYIKQGTGYFWGQCSFAGTYVEDKVPMALEFPTYRVSTDTNHIGQ